MTAGPDPKHRNEYIRAFPYLPIDQVVDHSRAHLGFFSAHGPRLFEYPWMLDRLRKLGCASVADFGAGVSPIPLMLAEGGTSVVTVDLSDRIVEIAPNARLTEWGFLDYGVLDPRIVSFNRSFETVDFPAPLDAVYSISVIEHVPARIRRRIFAHIGMLLPVGGHFVATLDLKPGTLDLWNFDRRQIVDQTGHGTLHDMVDELAGNRLKLVHLQIEQVQNTRGSSGQMDSVKPAANFPWPRARNRETAGAVRRVLISARDGTERR